MPTNERCELSDLPVDQCGCRIHKPDADEHVQRAMVFDGKEWHHMDTGSPGNVKAGFRSACPDCDTSIEPGQAIGINDANQWVHFEHLGET